MAWVRLPGSDRKYLNEETGQTLSRRQYDKVKHDLGIYKPITGTRKQQQQQYNNRLDDYIKSKETEGYKINRRQAQASTDFKQGKPSAYVRNYNPAIATPDQISRQVRALETRGLRHGIPSWVPPGESDKYRGLASPQKRGAFRRKVSQRGSKKGIRKARGR